MTLKSRLHKLTQSLGPEPVKVYYFGWADCTWSHSEGLIRQPGESKDAFCKRVHLATRKQYLWFD